MKSEYCGDLCMASVAMLTAGYKAGDLSPSEATQASLDRAEALNPVLNAFTIIDREGAEKAASASERRWREQEPLSPIDGVPVTIKDLVLCGLDTRSGSAVTNDPSSKGDAPAVERLRSAGAIIIGTTTTPEFGWKAVTDSPKFGITRNPWDSTKTPGGSSGGAAVAAAMGAGVLHLGTDGGGSIRIPASFTGIVGHKPTFGTVPAWPASAFGTVAHLGPMTRCVADATAMLNAMSGCDTRDWAQGWAATGPFEPVLSTPIGKRIGYWKRPASGETDPWILDHVESRVADLERAGAEIIPFDLPMRDELLEVFHRHWLVGAANRLSTISPANYDALDPGFLAAALSGARYSATQRMEAESTRSQFGAAMDAALETLDFVLSPTVAIRPFEAGRSLPAGSEATLWTDWAGFSYPVNLSQQPACSVPCGKTDDGLPVGLQIIGGRGRDEEVLSMALYLEHRYPECYIQAGAVLPPTFEDCLS